MPQSLRTQFLLQPTWTTPSTSAPLLLGVFLAILILLLLFREVFAPPHLQTLFQRKKWILPPGPAGYPLIGNFIEWRCAQKSLPGIVNYLSSLGRFGEMTTLHMGSRTWVVLNSPRVVSEIFSRHGRITHERPPKPVASDIISRGKRTLLQPTAEWAEGRRIMHQVALTSAKKTYTGMQELESVQMLANHLFWPKEWFVHHYRYTNSVLHRFVLGEGIVKSSPDLAELQRVTTEFVHSIEKSTIDYFPLLSKLPTWLQPWRAKYEKIGLVHNTVFRKWWQPIKQMIDQGTAPPSFARNNLLHPDSAFKGDDEYAMYVAMSTISAGSDSTRMVLNVLVMIAICYPDAIRKARLEADTVCGPNAERLPMTSDIDDMPYTCALIKEALRWRPLAPLLPPHVLTQELEFEGYRFPVGTEFMTNAIAVCNAVENPQSFSPERWLNGQEANVTHGSWLFGGGRRVCPGSRMAQTQLFVALARLTYCFNYTPAGECSRLFLMHNVMKEPFPVKVSVRSKAHETLIVKEATKAECLEIAKLPF